MARRTRWPALLLAAASLLAATAAAREFQAEGSDTGAGLGVRHIALGGAGLATSDDAYAAYHNPAALATLASPTGAVARQLDAQLQPLAYLGVASPLPLPSGWGWPGAGRPASGSCSPPR